MEKMEININNAFCEAVKFSLRPCYPLYVAVSDSIQRTMHKVVCRLLQAPLCTTFAAYFILIPLTIMLTFSSLTYIGIVCATIGIIMFEGISLVILFFVVFHSLILIFFVLMITHYH